MASHPPPVSPLRKRKFTPSGQTVVIAFVVLLILFLWLHFVLAQQIESTGRQIQARTKELEKIEREISDLEQEATIAGSEENLAARARALDYGPQTPTYLPLSQSSVQPAEDVGVAQTHLSTAATDREAPALQTRSLWASLVRGLNVSIEVEAAP